MWDLPGLGLEPVSPALAGRFLTIAPPGKPLSYVFINLFSVICVCLVSNVLGFGSCVFIVISL